MDRGLRGTTDQSQGDAPVVGRPQALDDLADRQTLWRRAAPFLDAITRTRPRSRDVNAAVAVADLRLDPEERGACGRRRLPRRRETHVTAVRHGDSGAAG